MKVEEPRVFVGFHEEADCFMFCIRVENIRPGYHFPAHNIDLRETPVLSVIKRVPKSKTLKSTCKNLFSEVRRTFRELKLTGYNISAALPKVPLFLQTQDHGYSEEVSYRDHEGTVLGDLDRQLYAHLSHRNVMFASEDHETNALLRASNWVASYMFWRYEDNYLSWCDWTSNKELRELALKRIREHNEGALKELKSMVTFGKNFTNFKLKKNSPLMDDFYLFNFASFHRVFKR